LTDSPQPAAANVGFGADGSMGIEGREYYRESSRYSDRLTGWGWQSIPPVCKWIILANIIVFLLQIFVSRPAQLSDFNAVLRESEGISPEQIELYVSQLPKVSLAQRWLELTTSDVLHGQIWRLLTYAFCHDRSAIWHLLFNMFFFYMFGPTLESMYGSREFLLFYLCSAVLSGVAYVGLDLVTRTSAPVIGASGAVMAVTMLYAIHYPRTIIYVMFIIPVEIRWIVLVYIIFDLHPVLLALAGDQVSTGVAHASHLGGLAFGFLYWKFNWRLDRFVGGVRMPRWDRTFGSRRSVRLYRPPPATTSTTASDAQVDDILRKIGQHGEASLTEDERQILIDASRRYQNRNRIT
jgi:membrane associated rhomboid family serine protease